MNIFAVTSFITAISSLLLAFFVGSRKSSAKVNKIWILVSIAVGFWSFGLGGVVAFENESYALISQYILDFSAIFIPILFFHFVVVLLKAVKKYKLLINIGYIIAFILVGISFTKLFKYGIIATDDFHYWIDPGPLYFIFPLFFLFGAILSLYVIFRNIKKTNGVQREQIKFVLVTAIIGFGGGLTNFLPQFSNLYPFGNFLVIFYVVSITYAIVKHRLLDIKIFVLRTITYSLVVLIISSAVVGATLLLPDALNVDIRTKTFIAIITSILIVIILDPLKKVIAKSTDKLFYKAGVDYQKLLTSLSEVINTEIDLDLLLYSMSRKLEHNLKVKNVAIFLSGSVGGAYYKRKGRIDPKTGKKIEKQNPDEKTALDYEHRLGHNSNIVNYLKKAKEIVVLEALERKIEDTQDEKERKVLEKSKKELDSLDASVVAPVTVGKELTGIMVFGPKLSGDPYGSEDINLLQLLGPQLASALEKSRLYEEAKQFNERLKKEVALATMNLQDTNVKLQEANKHLQQLDTAKSEFVSITSHQLRTPMTGIMGYLSMILQGDFGKVPKEQEKILSELLEESQRMIRIINLFLNVSKIESGKMELNLEPVQIEEVVERVMDMVQQPADDKKIKLIYNKPNIPLPMVQADKDKLGDIVLNFTDNAIKYTEKGNVTLITEVDGKYMHFAVKDTGRGIEPEEAEKLFTKFVRGFGIAQVNPDGSGLGLYVARRLTEAHHGEIWVDSEGVGKGSTFNVKIPLATFNDKKKTEK